MTKPKPKPIVRTLDEKRKSRLAKKKLKEQVEKELDEEIEEAKK
jgi:hypothetical protein